MIDIIPSILVKTKNEFLSQISLLEHSVTHLQLDIADGHFVPNTTWAETAVIKKIEGYTFELHLMVASPLEIISAWKNVPQVTRFIIHAESVEDIAISIEQARKSHKEIFIALNPDTSLEVLEPIHAHVDGALFMGVTPGFQGQKLLPTVLTNIRECRKKYPNLYTELDGGVSEDTLENILKSGVHAICPGSLVFRREQKPTEQILYIKNQLEKLDNQKTR